MAVANWKRKMAGNAWCWWLWWRWVMVRQYSRTYTKISGSGMWWGSNWYGKQAWNCAKQHKIQLDVCTADVFSSFFCIYFFFFFSLFLWSVVSKIVRSHLDPPGDTIIVTVKIAVKAERQTQFTIWLWLCYWSLWRQCYAVNHLFPQFLYCCCYWCCCYCCHFCHDVDVDVAVIINCMKFTFWLCLHIF